MQFKIVVGTALFLACAFNYSCTGMSAECRQFFLEQRLEEAEAKFKTYPREKQLELYFCGMKVEPPELWPAVAIADEGAQVIPFLLDRLKTENELNQYNIIYIFEFLAMKGHLRGKPEVILQLKQVVSVMKHHVIKKEAQQSLENIEKYSSKTS